MEISVAASAREARSAHIELPLPQLQLTAQNLNPPRGWLREGGVARWTLGALNLEDWLSAAGATTLTVSLEILERDGDDLEDARLLSPARAQLSRSASTATVRVELTDDALPEAGETAELSARAAGSTASAWAYIPRNDYQVADFQLSTERAYGSEPVYLTAQLNAAAPTAVRARYEIAEAAPGQDILLFSKRQIKIEAFSAVGRVELGQMHGFARGVYHARLVQEQGAFFIDSAERRADADGDQFYIPLAAGLEGRELEYERVGGSPTLEWQWSGAEMPRFWEALEGSTATLQLSADSLRPESPLRVELSHGADVVLSTTTVVLSAVTPTARVEAEALEDGEPEPYEAAAIEIRGLAGAVEFLQEAVVHIARNGYRAQLTATPTEIFLDEGVWLRVELNAVAPAFVAGWVDAVSSAGGRTGRLLSFYQPSGMEFHEELAHPEAGGTYRLEGRLILGDGDPGLRADQRYVDLEVSEGLRLQAWDAGRVLRLEWPGRDVMREGESLRMRVRMAGFPFGAEGAHVELETGGREDVEIEPQAVELSARTPTAQVEVRMLEDGRAESWEYLTLSGSAQLRGREIRGEAQVLVPRHGYEGGLEFLWEEVSQELKAVVSLNGAAHGERSDVWLVLELSSPENELFDQQIFRIVSGETTAGYSWEVEASGRYELDVFLAIFAGGRVSRSDRSYVDQIRVPVSPSRVSLEVELLAVPGGVVLPAVGWGATPTGLAVMEEGGELELGLHLLTTTAVSVEIEARVLPREHRRDLEASPERLRLLPGGPRSGRLRVRAVSDGEAEPEETVRLLLSGYAVEGGGYYGSRELRVLIPRHGYAVEKMRVRASSAHPADEFVVEMRLNAAAPWNSTVAVTVKAFAAGAESAAAEVRVEVSPGSTTGSGVISMREPGLYRLRAATAVFTLRTERGQQELELGAADAERTVRTLLDYDGSAGDGLITPLQLKILKIYAGFSFLDSLQLPGGGGWCTEEMRRLEYSMSPALHCLEVTGDGIAGTADLRLIVNYMENYEAIRDGRESAVLIFEGTELLGDSEEKAWEIIGRIQGLYVRTEENCRAFGIDCD